MIDASIFIIFPPVGVFFPTGWSCFASIKRLNKLSDRFQVPSIRRRSIDGAANRSFPFAILSRGGSRIFPREGRLVQRGGIFRVGRRRGLTWAPYPYPISYLYTYEYAISRNINFIDLR